MGILLKCVFVNEINENENRIRITIRIQKYECNVNVDCNGYGYVIVLYTSPNGLIYEGLLETAHEYLRTTIYKRIFKNKNDSTRQLYDSTKFDNDNNESEYRCDPRDAIDFANETQLCRDAKIFMKA